MSKSGFFFCLISSVHPLVLSLVTPPLQQRLFSPIQPRFLIFYLFIVVLWKVSKVLSLLKKTGYMLSKQWSGLVLKKQTCSDLVAVPHDAWKHPDLVNYRAHKENSYHYCLCLYKSLVILLTVTTAVGRTTLCHPRWLSPSFMYMDISPTVSNPTVSKILPLKSPHVHMRSAEFIWNWRTYSLTFLNCSCLYLGKNIWISGSDLWGSGWTLNLSSQCEFLCISSIRSSHSPFHNYLSLLIT